MIRIEIERIKEDKPGRKSRHFANLPFLTQLELKLRSLTVVKHYLSGTESSEWLDVAEDNIYKRMKNGSKN